MSIFPSADKYCTNQLHLLLNKKHMPLPFSSHNLYRSLTSAFICCLYRYLLFQCNHATRRYWAYYTNSSSKWLQALRKWIVRSGSLELWSARMRLNFVSLYVKQSLSSLLLNPCPKSSCYIDIDRQKQITNIVSDNAFDVLDTSERIRHSKGML